MRLVGVIVGAIVGISPTFQREGSQWVIRGPDYRFTASSDEIVITNLEAFGDVDHWFREEETRLRLVGALNNPGEAAGSRLAFRGVYPGIDFECAVARDLVECCFSSVPGADTMEIRIKFSGARRSKVLEDGSIAANTVLGEIRVYPPRGVSGTFVKKRSGEFGFERGFS